MKTINVVAAVMNLDGEYYAFKRSPNKSFGNLWEFPGGKIEFGETKQTALIREIREELDLDISVGKLIVETSYKTNSVVINISFFNVPLKEKITPVLNDHSEMRIINKETMTDLDWAPADIESLAYIFK